MKFFFMLPIIGLLMYGCSFDMLEESYLANKVEKWRESVIAESGEPIESINDYSDIAEAENILASTLSEITYSKTHDRDEYGMDYWQTASETLYFQKGDSEDIAIYNYEKMREAGFSDDRISIITLQEFRNIPGFFADTYVTVAAFWNGSTNPTDDPLDGHPEDWYLLNLDGSVTNNWSEVWMVAYYSHFDFFYQCIYLCF